MRKHARLLTEMAFEEKREDVYEHLNAAEMLIRWAEAIDPSATAPSPYT